MNKRGILGTVPQRLFQYLIIFILFAICKQIQVHTTTFNSPSWLSYVRLYAPDPSLAVSHCGISAVIICQIVQQQMLIKMDTH